MKHRYQLRERRKIKPTHSSNFSWHFPYDIRKRIPPVSRPPKTTQIEFSLLNAVAPQWPRRRSEALISLALILLYWFFASIQALLEPAGANGFILHRHNKNNRPMKHPPWGPGGCCLFEIIFSYVPVFKGLVSLLCFGNTAVMWEINRNNSFGCYCASIEGRCESLSMILTLLYTELRLRT